MIGIVAYGGARRTRRPAARRVLRGSGRVGRAVRRRRVDRRWKPWDGWRIAAQLSPEHVPPRWPDPAYPAAGATSTCGQYSETRRLLGEGGRAGCRAVAHQRGTGTRWPTRRGTRFDLSAVPGEAGDHSHGRDARLDCPDAKPAKHTFVREAPRQARHVRERGRGEDRRGRGAQPVMFQQILEYRAPRSGLTPRIRSSSTSTSRSTTSTRPRKTAGAGSLGATSRCPPAGRTGGSMPTRSASRSAFAGTSRAISLFWRCA